MAESVIRLTNDGLDVQISTHGAELLSIRSKRGTEFLWSADPSVWACHAPVLFPICGGLKDDSYIFEGKTYHLPKHGFAKLVDYTVERKTDDAAVLCYRPDDAHKAMYPFEYAFRVKFTLSGQSLAVTYEVENLDTRTMYFSLGAHEGYACPGGIEDYYVEFEKEEVLDSYILEGNLLSHRTVRLGDNTRILPLSYDYFAVDATVFKHPKSRKVTLRHKASSRKVTVAFPDHDYLVLWTKPGAPYLCIEPWCGVQDPVDASGALTEKEGICTLSGGATFERTHTILVEE